MYVHSFPQKACDYRPTRVFIVFIFYTAMSILLIVDMQEAFVSNEIVVRNIGSVSSKFDTIVATKFVSGNSLYQSELEWSLSDKQSQLTETAKDLVPTENIYEKCGYSALTNSDLQDRLTSENPDTVYVAGFETDACILSTAFDLFDTQIRPIVIESCCQSPTETLHTSARKILERNIGHDNVIHHTELDTL